MNQFNNRRAAGDRHCSQIKLIEATGNVNGKTLTVGQNGSGNPPAVVPAKRAAGGPGKGEPFPGNGARESARRIEECIAYMREHLDQPMPVAELAALANVSPSHFFALFKRHTGCAPMDYFTHLRMQRACRLLDGTPASVKEVAAALGYDDPFYFSRVFKSVHHVPPSRYRMAMLNCDNEVETSASPPVGSKEMTLASAL